MKISLVIFCLVILGLSANSQNLRLLQQFDKIPLSSKQYEIDGYMSTFSDYGNPEKNKYDNDNYSYVKYSAKTGSTILLCFNKGILYLKRLVVKYPINEMETAKSECDNIKSYVLLNNKIVFKSINEISNGVYGGTIGQSYSYYLNTSTKNHKSKTVNFEETLLFDIINGKQIAKIIGYEIEYESVDLSKTGLDSKTGFDSIQN